MRQARLRWARTFATRPFAWSPSCYLVWAARDRSLSFDAAATQKQLVFPGQVSKDFQLRGPTYPTLPRQELCRALAAQWARSSVLMNDISRGRGMTYLHFLEPNQYVPNSKPFGRAERLVAFDSHSGFRSPVVDCYPALIEAGRSLAVQGVQFHDLSRIFADHPEPLYKDSCCHLNQEGYRLLARAIGRVAVEALAARRSPG